MNAPLRLAEIAAAAAERFPHAVALHQDALHLTYARLARDVERVAGHLQQQGIGPGMQVATDIRRPVSQWLVLLALMRLGAVSVTLTGNRVAEVAALPSLAALVTHPEQDSPPISGLRTIGIGRNWLAAPADVTLPPPDEAARRLGRICFTSGTTGRPRAVLLDAGLLARRLGATARRSRIDTRTVLWCGIGPDTAYGFTAMLAAWLEGAAVILSPGGAGAWRYMSERHVNLILASPSALGALLRDAAAGTHPKMQGPAIVAGGRLSLAMRDALAERLCSDVLIAFGSSEAGGITLGSAEGLSIAPSHVGRLFDDVEARTVDEAGRVQPAGQPGQLQIRTPSCARGYIDDPQATAAHFAGGWFQPGDVAKIGPDGTLTLLGRPEDVLNLGGVKVSAVELEAAVRGYGGIEDACAVLLPLPGGGHRLAIAILGEPTEPAALAAHVRRLLPQTPRFALVAVSAIPRGSMGKINRDRMARLMAGASWPDESAPEISAQELGSF